VAATGVRGVLFHVLGVIADIELVATRCAVVAPCGFYRQLEARHALYAVGSACSTNDDIVEFEHQALAEPFIYTSLLKAKSILPQNSRGQWLHIAFPSQVIWNRRQIRKKSKIYPVDFKPVTQIGQQTFPVKTGWILWGVNVNALRNILLLNNFPPTRFSPIRSPIYERT
jgi:hypothetical protein